MTPKQKEMMVRSLLSRRIYLNGGEYHTIKSMHRKGWTTEEWWIGSETITLTGLEALRNSCDPLEIFAAGGGTYLLMDGRPIAQIVSGQERQVEKLIGNQGI